MAGCAYSGGNVRVPLQPKRTSAPAWNVNFPAASFRSESRPGPAGPAKSRLPDGLPGEFQRKAPRCLTFFRSFPRPFLRPSPACKGCMKGGERRPALSGKNRPMRRARPHGDATCVRLRPMLRLLLIRLKAGKRGTRAFALRGAERRRSPQKSSWERDVKKALPREQWRDEICCFPLMAFSR